MSLSDLGVHGDTEDEEEKNDDDGNSSVEILDDFSGDDLEDDNEDDLEDDLDESSDFQREGEEGYDVLNVEQVTKLMTDFVSQVTDVTQIPSNHVWMLLVHFNWNRELLMENVFGENRTMAFVNAKIIDPNLKPPTSASINNNNNRQDKPVECTICFEKYNPTEEMTGLECGHMFCNECWAGHLEVQVTSEGVGQMIGCAYPGCKVLLGYQTVMSLLQNEATKEKYQCLLANNFVQHNRYLQWCPAPGCNRALRGLNALLKTMVTCSCGHSFCFACALDNHEPVDCRRMEFWNGHGAEEAESVKWISAHTQKCPQCNVNIVKNGGCQFMQCRQCRYEFCWQCLIHAPGHRHHVCHVRFVEGVGAGGQQYLFNDIGFYQGNYNKHQQAAKEETPELEEKVAAARTAKSLTSSDLCFLDGAIRTLAQCRRASAHAYIFDYFLRPNNQRIIFEENLRNFSQSVESLSLLLKEDDWNRCDFILLKDKIVSQDRYCQQRQKSMMAHVQEGLDKDWWLFTY